MNTVNENEEGLKPSEFAQSIIEAGREVVVDTVANFSNMNAYFSISEEGKIKRKKFHYIIPGAVFIESDDLFLKHLDVALEGTNDVIIGKIPRMTNEEDKRLYKNIKKLIAKGSFNYLLPYCKEIYSRDEERFFKILYDFVLMDNMDFNKAIQVYSMRKYFKKFGYSDKVLYMIMGYVSKMRADFYEYENSEDSPILKEKIKEKIINSKDKLKTKEGFEILCYLKILEEFDYKNEKKYIDILNNKFEIVMSKEDCKRLTDVEETIFNNIL